MAGFILRRLLTALITLVISSFLVCMLMHLIPGDPVIMMMAQNSSPSPAFLGPNLTNAMIAVGLSAVPYYARVTYGVVLSERQKPYIDAARVVGASHVRVIIRHLLPNVLAPMIVVASLGFSAAVLSAAALSFLGLGAQPPTPEWGLMLSTGRNYITRARWLVIEPGLAIFVTVVAFNVFGDGVRDLLDPRQRPRTL